MFATSAYQYDLPPERIAQYPCAPRSQARLLMPTGSAAGVDFAEARFMDLPRYLRAGDLLIVNDTRVSPVRLLGEKDSGGRAELFVETLIGTHQGLARCKLSHGRAGVAVHINHPLQPERVTVRLIEKVAERWRIEVQGGAAMDLPTLIERFGHMPIPPYLARADEPCDREHYQTLFAKHAGAVAAPTAGLHFDAALMQGLAAAGIEHAFVTLQVGAGTFVPIRAEDIRHHTMHRESFDVPRATVESIAACKARGGRVVAVGTTSMRALETAAIEGGGRLIPYQGESQLFITPGFSFGVVDGLITNFHQSASTLMVLVSTFAGHALIRETYQYALQHDFRFLSYGDGMLLWRDSPALIHVGDLE